MRLCGETNQADMEVWAAWYERKICQRATAAIANHACKGGTIVFYAGNHRRPRSCSLLVLSRYLSQDRAVAYCLCDAVPAQVARRTPFCWPREKEKVIRELIEGGAPEDWVQSFHDLFGEKLAATKQFARQAAERYGSLPHHKSCLGFAGRGAGS